MANYDFRVLNDKEFEVLVADLLSAELGVKVERFKAGKDKGVDLRWYASPGAEVVVQCKHWPRSTLTTIIRHISSEELPKVKELRPKRYLFVCSLELSRLNKRAISTAFSPYICSEADVIGVEGLQDLLEKHPEVERRHYKLWLSSSAVLVSLINNAVLGRSDDALTEIKSDLSKYIDTSESVRARERLVQLRVVIIKGEPGVGKTTLAQHLVRESVADGFKLIVIENDINEAEDVFDADSKQIFYFDDFLGRNFLEAIDDNKDSHIVNFIKRITRNKNKRFILTTRTHILDRGKQLSELFRIEKIGKNEFELSIGALSRLEKGMILYSHIWNSGMPGWAVDELYKDERYLEVVDHQNYNPRIISFITDPDRLSEIDSDGFWAYVSNTLNYPEAIWRHVFEHQIGADSRDLAVLVACNGKSIGQEQLENAFIRLNRHSNDNSLQLRQRFATGFRLAVGSVLNRVIESGGPAKCSLFNPSITDYLLKDGEVAKNIVELTRSLRTLDSMNYLESLLVAKLVSEEVFNDCLNAVCQDMLNEDVTNGELAVYLAYLSARWKAVGVAAKYAAIVSNELDVQEFGYSSRNSIFVFSEFLCSDQIADAANKYQSLFERLDELPQEVDCIGPLYQCATHLDAIDNDSRALRFRERVLELWHESTQEMVTSANILDDLFDPSDCSLARITVRRHFAAEFDAMGMPLDDDELDYFSAVVDYDEIINDNISSASDEYNDDESGSPKINLNSEIIDYFDRVGAEPSV